LTSRPKFGQPVYAVAAEDDHIAPWRADLQGGEPRSYPAQKRFVLSSSGHILGIVNPPVNPPKREFWVADVERHDTADGWRERAQHQAGSWWEDWMAWLKPQSGKLVKAGEVATETYPALCDAPGTYVVES
jgi:polyhydroxyalkanoate synthase